MAYQIIFAPSGAGKSHAARESSAKYIDGDIIIASTTGWPPGRWWDDEALKEQTLSTNTSTLVEYLRTHDGPTVLMNTDPKRFPVDILARAAVWIPPKDGHLLNLQRRSAAGPTVQPTDVAEVKGNVLSLLRDADVLGLPVLRALP
jgi:hypothetical protein